MPDAMDRRDESFRTSRIGPPRHLGRADSILAGQNENEQPRPVATALQAPPPALAAAETSPYMSRVPRRASAMIADSSALESRLSLSRILRARRNASSSIL